MRLPQRFSTGGYRARRTATQAGLELDTNRDVVLIEPNGTRVKLKDLSGAASSDGALIATDFLFTEESTAGVYTATLAVLAGSTVLDVFLYPLSGAWAADTASFDMGDVLTSATAYYSAIDPKLTIIGPYDPTNVNPSTNFCNLGSDGNTYGTSGAGGTGIASIFSVGTAAGGGIRYATDDTLTMTLTTTIASPPVVPAGELLARVLMLLPSTATDAAFA